MRVLRGERGMDRRERFIDIDWLHKQLIEAMYERKLSSEVLSVFHEIIAKWRKENEETDNS